MSRETCGVARTRAYGPRQTRRTGRRRDRAGIERPCPRSIRIGSRAVWSVERHRPRLSATVSSSGSAGRPIDADDRAGRLADKLQRVVERLSGSRAIAEAVRGRRPRAGGRRLGATGCWAAKSKDIDIEVYGVDAAALRTLLEAFGRVETVGESFQVYKLGDIDVSLPRRESKSGRGHRGFDVTGDPAMTSRKRRGGATSPSTRSPGIR